MGAFQLAESLQREENLVFLHSGMSPGTKSIVAWGTKEKFELLNHLKKRHPALVAGSGSASSITGSRNKSAMTPRLYGYLGYGLRTTLENFPRQKDSFITLPDITLIEFSNEKTFPMEHCHVTTQPRNHVTIQSNMTDDEYKSKVSVIIKKIHEGELYQANLTRKFYGEFKTAPAPLELFAKLCSISPAPYSAYLKFGDTHILSASPEKFLTIENGIATTSPIKGTLSTDSPAALLAMSEKDRAENLMIVDLMRNDLSKTCTNVRVPKLFEVTSYTKYHHMSSTITGEIAKPPLDVALGCFPPGSMTGAPKIHAVKLCSELEDIERGIYSGALGWISPDACDLSVVIRTLIIQGNKFEFQVGGGIVADSTPEKELEEIYVKAKPILEVLGLRS